MSHSTKVVDEVPIPEIIVDKSTGTKYLRGKFYGKVNMLASFVFNFHRKN